MRVSYGDISAGFTLFTVDPGPEGSRADYVENIGGFDTYTGFGDYKPNQSGFGAAYVGFGGYRAGWNSEGIRHIIQNKFAHDFLRGGFNFNTPGDSKHFKRMPSGYPGRFYGGFHSTNRFSLWE